MLVRQPAIPDAAPAPALPLDVRLMNAVAAVVFVLALAALAAAAFAWAARRPQFQFADVRLEGDLQRNSVTTVRANALPHLAGNFFTMDLARARAAFEPWLQDAARRNGVSRSLLAAVMFVESRYNPNAISNKGALGLMQVMPATGRRFGVEDKGQLFDPRVNIEVAARYLHALMEMFGGRLDLVVAAYNAGEGAVQRSGNRVPPFDETQQYVRKVLTLL